MCVCGTKGVMYIIVGVCRACKSVWSYKYFVGVLVNGREGREGERGRREGGSGREGGGERGREGGREREREREPLHTSMYSVSLRS